MWRTHPRKHRSSSGAGHRPAAAYRAAPGTSFANTVEGDGLKEGRRGVEVKWTSGRRRTSKGRPEVTPFRIMRKSHTRVSPSKDSVESGHCFVQIPWNLCRRDGAGLLGTSARAPVGVRKPPGRAPSTVLAALGFEKLGGLIKHQRKVPDQGATLTKSKKESLQAVPFLPLPPLPPPFLLGLVFISIVAKSLGKATLHSCRHPKQLTPAAPRKTKLHPRWSLHTAARRAHT